MSAFVVDTNVPVVANGRSEQADPDCVTACLDALQEVRNGGIIVLDDAGWILAEYVTVHGVKKPRFCFKNGGKTSQCSTIFRQTFVFGSKTAITRERLPEYMQNLSMSGQPGAGDAFMKWVWSVQADSSKCEQVVLSLRGGGADDFNEFPADSDLANFDRADRKFVTVHGESPFLSQ